MSIKVPIRLKRKRNSLEPNDTVPPRRGRGTRANLTRDAIVSAARKLVEDTGSVELKALSERLGVTSNAITANLLVDRSTVANEVAKRVFRELAPPHGPKETWERYLTAIFDRAACLLAESPGTARLIAPFVAQIPFFGGDLTERFLHVIVAADIAPERAVVCLDIVLVSLAGLLVVCAPTMPTAAAEWQAAVDRGLASVMPGDHPLTYAHVAILEQNAIKKSPVGSVDELRLFANEIALGVIEKLRSNRVWEAHS